MRYVRLVVSILCAWLAAAPTPVSAQTLTTLYTFTGPDGNSPLAGLFRDSAGNLYGTTSYGGASGFGVVFKLDTSNNETVLYSFAGGSDGANPYGGLVRDSAGNFYGTTLAGGSPTCQCGTVFKLSNSNKETVLYRFRGGTDGAVPYASVIRDSAGNLYGTTSSGGYNNNGMVYKVNASGEESVLHRFSGSDYNSTPIGGVIRDSSGSLYGTVNGNDTGAGHGVVFKLDASNHYSVLYNGLSEGSRADLNFCFSGDICGTSFQENVWKITKSGSGFTILYNFPDYNSGCMLESDVAQNSTGDLYGTASSCGQDDVGLLYEVPAGGAGKTVYIFGGNADGAYPQGDLVQDSEGTIYGTTSYAGDSACYCGTVFKFTP